MTRAAISELPPRTDSALGQFPSDNANVAVHPPVLWIVLLAAGCGLDILLPLTFLPPGFPAVWVGGAVWLAGFGLAAVAIVQFRGAGVDERTNTPTAKIVDTGVFAFSRNPIYVGAYVATVGVAVIYNMLWILATLIPFYLVIRYGVVAREEAYLERKFGAAYLAYKAHVRRWI
jgi:protein-S-isoprenylcysteine O-methyltransferase Ste14